MLVEQTEEIEQWKFEIGGVVFTPIYDILFPGTENQSLDIKLIFECEENDEEEGDTFEISGKVD